MGQFVEVLTREAAIKELEAERRALDQELEELNRREKEEKRTGGIPLPIEVQKKYPCGPKPICKGSKPARTGAQGKSPNPTIGGKPPGLRLEQNEDGLAAGKKEKEPRGPKGPKPRLSEKQLQVVSRALDI